jgi:hypothetical integral membrane protein (TIGR02206 family)
MEERLFFTYRDQIPDGLGFEHYGLKHILFLLGITAFVVLFGRLYKRSGEWLRRRMRVGAALVIVLMEAMKQTLLAVQGNYTWEILPLHLCGMTIFLIAIHTLRPNRVTGEILYALSIPGAVFALLCADWTMYPIWNFFCLQSFLIHMMELAYPIMLLGTGEIRPRVGRLWIPALYLAVVTPIIYRLNHVWDTNFFFINEAAPGSPMSLLQGILGSPGYVFGTGGVVALVWIVLYTPIVVKARRSGTGHGDAGKLAG